ncbi:hypothetical protein HZH66_013457 [Vespula vulgaris]|uniref:Uncharacterized protein n=1 Tax=Vespula vulgaris TaxID=7454 RepID=A0A834MRL9_VESVU|nr:hypothetical protein HZH66_013457 [Vespula vulgaris]
MLILQWINKGSACIKEESFFINPGVGRSSCKDQRRLYRTDCSRIRVSASLKMVKRLVYFFYRRILIVVEILLLLVYKDVEFAHFLSTSTSTHLNFNLLWISHPLF